MHSMFVRACATLVAALALSACATGPAHIALPDPARDKIASTDVVLPIRQNEIYVFVPVETAGAGFGLIGALVDVAVDSARTSKAEAAVKPLRDATVDYTFDTTLQADMKAALSQLAWLGVDKVRISKQVTMDGVDGEVENSPDGAVLIATADYRLDNDGNVLIVTIGSILLPHNDGLRAIKPPKKGKLVNVENALYRNTIAFETKLDGGGSNRDANIAAWSADNGKAMRAALDLASKKVSALLAEDIARSPADTVPANAHTAKLSGFEGTVIGTDADGTTLRFKDGTLAYATKAVLPQ